MPIKLCISVAVSKPEVLDALPGAIEASRAIQGWATAAGFATEAITDARPGSSVTVAGLRARLTPLLANTAQVIDHLIFHFAGHGLKNGAEDQFLLLSKWQSRPDEAIKLALFVRLLQFYQPSRVSLFLDACRSEAPKGAADELNGSGVLDRPSEEPVEFLEDRFRAAVAGKASYMISDAHGGPPHCLFSSVLLNAFCGKYPEAIETRGAERVVTSAKIYGAVTHHLPLEAVRYRVSLTPSLKPAFVPPSDVYTRLPFPFEPPPLPGPSPLPMSPAPSMPQDESAQERAERRVQDVKATYATEQRPTHFETGAGLAVDGPLLSLPPVASPPVEVQPDDQTAGRQWWRFKGPNFELMETASVAVTTVSGAVVGVAAVPNMIVSISTATDARQKHVGAASVIYRPAKYRAPDDEVEAASAASEDVIARMRAGALDAEEALSVATRIRGSKHANPMLGVIAAYLYDANNDRDSIRRIAWFYANSIVPEPIPFDVALLADLRGERGLDGRIRVRVPAVSQRAPRTPDEEAHPEYFCATTEVAEAVVAGGFPWLRQGWALLRVSRLPFAPVLMELGAQLLPFSFTTLLPEAGRVLQTLIRDERV